MSRKRYHFSVTQCPTQVIGAKTAKKHENNRGEGEGVGVRGLFEKDAVFCLDFAE